MQHGVGSGWASALCDERAIPRWHDSDAAGCANRRDPETAPNGIVLHWSCPDVRYASSRKRHFRMAPVRTARTSAVLVGKYGDDWIFETLELPSGKTEDIVLNDIQLL